MIRTYGRGADLKVYQNGKEVGNSGIRAIEKEAMMIRVFDLDEPTTEIDMRPDTLVQPVDLLHYLSTSTLRFVGTPVPIENVPLTDAMVVETGHDDDFGATVVMRIRTRSESVRANAAH